MTIIDIKEIIEIGETERISAMDIILRVTTMSDKDLIEVNREIIDIYIHNPEYFMGAMITAYSMVQRELFERGIINSPTRIM